MCTMYTCERRLVDTVTRALLWCSVVAEYVRGVAVATGLIGHSKTYQLLIFSRTYQLQQGNTSYSIRGNYCMLLNIALSNESCWC